VRLVGMVADITQRKPAEEAPPSVRRRLIDSAQGRRRARIARDLRLTDRTALALLSVELEQLRSSRRTRRRSCRALTPPHRTAEIATDVQASLSHELHSSRLQVLGRRRGHRGFCTELAEQQKVTIRFTHEAVPDNVPPDMRCVSSSPQEALRNAGGTAVARSFTVHLRGAPDGIGLTVRDAGRGFDLQSPHNAAGLA
jgi:signal transduction histidine kinase